MWARLTETPVLLSIISVLSAAIIVPWVKKLYFDVQTRLRVEVRANEYHVPTALKAMLKSLPSSDAAWSMMNVGGYVKVVITNRSRKRITGVTATVAEDMFGVLCQLNDADELIEVKRGKAAMIGDIQPGHVRVLHVWMNLNLSHLYFTSVKELLHISADEVDAVHFRFPMPWYQVTKYIYRAAIAVALASVAIIIGLVGWVQVSK